MRRTWLVAALLLSLGVNLGLAGAVLWRSRPAADGRHGATGEPGRRLADWLDLDGGERAGFLAVQRRLADSVVAERREIARLRSEIRRELLSDAPDRERLDGLVAELGEREQALDAAFVESVLASRERLSGRALERYLRFVERFGSSRGTRAPGDETPWPRRRAGPGRGAPRD